MMANRGSRGLAPLILNLGTGVRQVVKITLQPLHLWYNIQCALKRRLGGPQSTSERYGEDKNPLPMPRLEPQTFKPVA